MKKGIFNTHFYIQLNILEQIFDSLEDNYVEDDRNWTFSIFKVNFWGIPENIFLFGNYQRLRIFFSYLQYFSEEARNLSYFLLSLEI